MLGNCEKMVDISSTTKNWPQNQVDETGLMASSGRVMEKPGQDQALKCPRCDSSNTKFCYYNNYSLSQPRHFCKACKRYWTRGGTLRNVPVGGGCRKNKRVKTPAGATEAAPALTTTTTTTTPIHPPQIDVSAASNHMNHLLYGLPNNPSDIDLAFSRFNSRASNMENTEHGLQPQLNALGFTSEAHDHDEYRSGYNPTTPIQDVVIPNSIFSNYSLFGSSSSASLIASRLQQQKLILGSLKESRGTNHFQALLPFEDLQMSGMVMKDVKMEEGNQRMSNNMGWNVPRQNPIEPIGSLDPSLYNWNATSVGAWPDLNNFGSSVTPLI
ncbi:hypothetical protein HHK36_005293 [Tetracentron sinense]|uniref:Dof zinc finger protein n=1 Tax=Tetracentron sinense TaxID=13715 RepID=A0A835DQK7_TETSI|nr:hypothetical protein HHK36_005293 [Tetracentron sinense]